MPCYGSLVVRSKWGEPMEVPCGQCIGCRLEKARQWAVRCVHESQMHEENCFITLTYNNDNLPDDSCVSKREIQLFMKRLRNYYDGKEIRFYACGEYGDRLGRPHYHMCLFGHDFSDKKVFRGSRFPSSGAHFKKETLDVLYRSNDLEQLWQKGFSSIGNLTFESAGYVARYCMKKITGEKADDHYNGKTPEFALMSRRPGIGAPWYEKYKTDVYPKDFFTLNGIRQKPPRYYDSLLEKDDPVLYEKIKGKRELNARDEDSLRKFQLSEHRKLITKSLNRSYEND